MLNTEQKTQFSEILEELGKSLDITEKQHDDAVAKYKFVGDWLCAEGSPVSIYEPEILPQGSFMLGTMIQPINEEDELDIDLVCRFEGKQSHWTQYDLKQEVGKRLKSHGTINKLIVTPEGRRCWTLQYSEGSKFHMDILPSIVSAGYKTILKKAFTTADYTDTDSLAIRITDNENTNYYTSPDPNHWLKCNPFGYGLWFGQKASLLFQKSALLTEAVQPVPKYLRNKLPLQRAVQILKRHRDIMFCKDEHKPISIIISTLAARSYSKEGNVIEALLNIVEKMPSHIEERYSEKYGRVIKWIPNPVNPEENFADRWVNAPEKEISFYRWLDKVQKDLINSTQMRGMHLIQESLEKPFGKSVISKAFNNYSDNLRIKRENGILKMAPGTGLIGNVGTKVKDHNFHGKEE